MFKLKNIVEQGGKKTDLNIDHSLFHYIRPTDNDTFSKMRGIDLQDLLYYLDRYYLELRESLGLDEHFTFGLELEFEHAMWVRIKEQLKVRFVDDGWRMVEDYSLSDGAEINSPILIDTSKSWNDLKEVCSIVDDNAIIGPSSGGHIHIGTQVIGGKKTSWLHFIKLWSVYENIIYRFCYGEFLGARPNIMQYARPMSEELWQFYEQSQDEKQLSTQDIIDCFSRTRNQAFNLDHVKRDQSIQEKNTIEFRCPNGTLNPVIWQNNVNLFMKILLYSKNSQYDDDIVQKRRSIHQDKYSGLIWYKEVYLEEALELCDMLFDNNLDKVYFLKQYLKSFEVSDKELDRAKTFTK